MATKKRALRIVVLDGRRDAATEAVTRVVAEALATDPGSAEEAEADGESPAAGAATLPGAPLDSLLGRADVAVALDAPSLARAKEAGVPISVALLPSFDLTWSGDLSDADLVLVAHEALVPAVLERGARRGSVASVGVVAPHGFVPPASRDALRRDTGVDPDRPLVLVPADVLEHGGLQEILTQLALVRGPVGFLFDVAEDVELADTLRALMPAYRLTAWMFATGPDAPRAWQLADVVVGRARSDAAARALGVGAPLVLPPPGRTEQATTSLVESLGVARASSSWVLLAATLDAALAAPALARAREAVVGLEVARTPTRIAAAVRAAWRERRAPHGLPQGLERISLEARPSREVEGPGLDRTTVELAREGAAPGDDFDARLERELEKLKERL